MRACTLELVRRGMNHDARETENAQKLDYLDNLSWTSRLRDYDAHDGRSVIVMLVTHSAAHVVRSTRAEVSSLPF